jgi:hypothetical protein
MTFCRCRPCRLGIIGTCVGAWLGVNTAGCYAHDAPDVEAVPLGAFSGLTVTTGTSGMVAVFDFLNRSAAMADEPVRMLPIERWVAAYAQKPAPSLVWPPGWNRRV